MGLVAPLYLLELLFCAYVKDGRLPSRGTENTRRLSRVARGSGLVVRRCYGGHHATS